MASSRAWSIMLLNMVLILQVASQEADHKFLTIGFLVAMEGAWDGGRTMAPTVPVAIEDLNGTPLLHGYTLKYIWKNSACSPGTALKEMTNLLSEGIDLLLGPSCSICCEPTQLLASTINLAQVKHYLDPSSLFRSSSRHLFLQVSYSCTSGTLSDKNLYPTFVRTVGPYSVMGPAMVTIFRQHGWNRCAFVTSTQVRASFFIA